MKKRPQPKTPYERRRWDMDRERHWGECRMPRRHRERLGTAIRWPDRVLTDRAWRTVIQGGTLALLGGRGTGKTQLAAQFMAGFIDVLGGSAQYYRADELFEKLRPSGEVGAAIEKFRRMLNCTDLLVVDEVQDRVDSAYEDRELRRIVDSRYGSFRATVLICNQTPEAFAESVGPSIISRLAETGCMLTLPWESFREPGGAE